MIRAACKKIFGRYITNIYRQLRKYTNKIIWYGRNVECNICDSYLRKWSLYGDKEKVNRICPVCYSFGRQRFLWYCIENSFIEIKPGLRILHIAPEMCIRHHLEKITHDGQYFTGDLNEEDVDIQIDITNITQPDSSYDLIICSHVMEHVPDDDRALSEFHRILKAEGKLIIQVPLSGSKQTYENNNITTPQERASAYGQSDHLRLYGLDFMNKIRSHGYNLTVLDPKEHFDKSRFDYFAFDLPSSSSSLYDSESIIFICQK